MNNIPKKLREECARDPFYSKCARFEALHDHTCMPDPLTGRMIEWEHAMIHAGKQIQAKWAIIPLCYFSHRGPALNKAKNVWIALNRATDEDLLPLCRAHDYFHYRAFLNKKYGPYNVPTPEDPYIHILYPWLREPRNVDNSLSR